MEIVKKNMLLVIVLSVSIVASIVLLVLVIKKHQVIKQYQDKVSENREKIKKLIEDRDAPVKENLINIEADTSKIQKKVEEIHLIFGRPYRKAIQAFAESLGVDELELYRSWNKIYAKEQKTSRAPQIFIKFIATFPEEKVEEAKKAFTETFEKHSVEPFDNIDDLIIEGLGSSRDITPEACKYYMSNMEAALNDLLTNPKIGKGVSIACEDKSIFQVYSTRSMPVHEQIPYIMKHYKLLEDVIFRLKECGIMNIKSLSKVTELEGNQDKGYLYLTYRIEIIGGQDSVRDFINSLYGAYVDNRVYILKNIKMEKIVDEVKDLKELKTHSKVDSGDESAFKTAVAVPVKNEEAAEAAPEAVEVLFGMANEIKAEIKFEYVIYLGDTKMAGGK